jgi:predicted small lipoprotein YifL
MPKSRSAGGRAVMSRPAWVIRPLLASLLLLAVLGGCGSKSRLYLPPPDPDDPDTVSTKQTQERDGRVR